MRKKVLTVSTVALVTLSFFLAGCAEDSFMGPDPAQSKAIPADQIQWIGWSAEVQPEMEGIGKIGFAGKMITPQSGGIVGGNMTLENCVEIPAGAVDDNTFVTVEVLCLEGHEQCGAGVEFLPSGSFNKPVTITLSWEYLEILTDEDAAGFKIYFSEDADDAVWYELDPSFIVIDYENKLVIFQADHFTRYQWGL